MKEIKLTQGLLDQINKKFNNIADNLEKVEEKINEIVRGYEIMKIKVEKLWEERRSDG